MEQGVGGVGAGDSPPFRGERRDGRFDDLDFLAAKGAAFARMRVEPGNREARIGDPEIALEAAQHGSAARFDQRSGQLGDDVGKRQMSRGGNGSQGRPGQHHRDIA